jgi:bis(5'-adenosyl)-triphosphatase
MQPDELSDLFLTAQQVQRGMELFHGVSSSNVAVQDGPDAGQSIQVRICILIKFRKYFPKFVMNSFESFQHVHVHILPRRPKDFKENDQIYDELNNHDKGPNVNWRQEEDMKKEASELRLFFATL